MTGQPKPPVPPGPGWCHWHAGPSGTAVLIDVVEGDSGYVTARYACAPCREQRPLTPYSEKP